MQNGSSNKESAMGIQLFTHTSPQSGVLFGEDNTILFLISGKVKMKYGEVEESIGEGQLVFLKKNILIAYDMQLSMHTRNIKYLVFLLSAELVTEFTKLAELSAPLSPQILPFVVSEDKSFWPFIEAYLQYPENIQRRLCKMKLMELLFYIASNHPAILDQLLQLRQSYQPNITKVIEENILNSISLQELALLAGRSLSSFRRDFLSIYNMPPSQWIRQQRLEKARDLLRSTAMSITDVCYTAGFENLAHFSRLFKTYFRCSPSSYRQSSEAA